MILLSWHKGHISPGHSILLVEPLGGLLTKSCMCACASDTPLDIRNRQFSSNRHRKLQPFRTSWLGPATTHNRHHPLAYWYLGVFFILFFIVSVHQRTKRSHLMLFSKNSRINRVRRHIAVGDSPVGSTHQYQHHQPPVLSIITHSPQIWMWPTSDLLSSLDSACCIDS